MNPRKKMKFNLKLFRKDSLRHQLRICRNKSHFILKWKKIKRDLAIFKVLQLLKRITLKNFNKLFSIQINRDPRYQVIKFNTSRNYLDQELIKKAT